MSGTIEDRLWDAIEQEDYRNARLLLQKCWTKTTKPVRDGIAIIHLLSGLEGQEANSLLEDCLFHGASPNTPSTDGITPVHLAGMWGLYDNLRTLVTHGGDPEKKDNDGLNAIDYARQSSEAQAGLCVEYLLMAKELIDKDQSSTLLSQTNYSDGYPNECSLNVNDNQEGYTHIKPKALAPQTYFMDPQNLMTEDESSICTVENSHCSSFYTADEGDFTMMNAGNVNDTVISFPKLHPWASKAEEEVLEDTLVGEINNLHLKNNRDSFEGGYVADSSMHDNTINDGTIIYDWKEYSILEISSDDPDSTFTIPDELLIMTCQEVKDQLTALGQDLGPVRADTRNLYIRQLARLKSGLTETKPSDQYRDYLPEMRAVLVGRTSPPEMLTEEESMCVEFNRGSLRKTWREGTEKSSFNYLLLDPRVTQNLPRRVKGLPTEDVFKLFIAAVFYVGKGKRSRPYAHLHEALHLSKTNRKLQHIRDIWAAELGVVSLHCFQSVIPVEAYTREACMVEALGLTRLTNKKKGDYYGRAKGWSLRKKREMGIFLLKRALHIFLNEGERQIRPEDLKKYSA